MRERLYEEYIKEKQRKKNDTELKVKQVVKYLVVGKAGK